MEFKRMTAKMP